MYMYMCMYAFPVIFPTTWASIRIVVTLKTFLEFASGMSTYGN